MPIVDYGTTLGIKELKRIIVYAFPPDSNAFNFEGFDELSKRLKVQGTLLYDKNSRDIYGPMKLGEEVQLEGQPYTIVGHTYMGPNLVNDGANYIGYQCAEMKHDADWFHFNKVILFFFNKASFVVYKNIAWQNFF